MEGDVDVGSDSAAAETGVLVGTTVGAAGRFDAGGTGLAGALDAGVDAAAVVAVAVDGLDPAVTSAYFTNNACSSSSLSFDYNTTRVRVLYERRNGMGNDVPSENDA